MKNISKIRIQGGFYDELIDINLRVEEKHRVSTIYGNNGSGKSSIANAFYEYKTNDENLKDKEFNEVKLLNDESENIELSIDKKNNIWVYSEKYIQNNIFWDKDNLGSIVMFGEQIDIDSDIKEKTSELNTKTDNLNNIKLQDYTETKGDKSIEFASEQIKKELRDRWASREKKIRKSNVAQVNEGIFNKVSATDLLSQTEYKRLLLEFSKREKEFSQIDDKMEKLYSFSLKTITTDDIEKITYLLSKEIPRPQGNDIERKLLDLIYDGKREMVIDSYNHFNNDHNNDCPYCLQKINLVHKEMLINSIKQILNEEVDKHTEDLKKIKDEIDILGPDLNYLLKFKNDETVELINKISIYNNEIRKIMSKIDDKIENPYESQDLDINILSISEAVNKDHKELSKFIEDFNISIDKIDETKADLSLINIKLARFEIQSEYNQWIKLRSDLNNDREKFESLTKEIIDLKNLIKELNSKKSNVDIALKEINLSLQSIFSGNNRLTLELDENSNYRIKTRGKRTRFKNLSTGEQNVITLCYFFAHLRINTSALTKFKEPYFIILDDPISSLDFDNRIGIYSYLRKVCDEILSNNDESRVLVLTHDLEVVYRLDKVFSDIYDSLNRRENFYCTLRLLQNKKSQATSMSNMNSYKWNMEEIYEYAKQSEDEDSDNDFYMGNIIRKNLEAYSTFNFRKSFDKILNNKVILSRIEPKELSEYFKNRMFRLLLNSESHTEYRTKAFLDYETFEQFSRSERIKTSKDILCFFYLLDQEHLESYLPNCISDVKRWIDEIQV